MAYIYTEGDKLVVQLPLVTTAEGEAAEEIIELKADHAGKIASGPFATLQEAYSHALDRLQKAIKEAEEFLDRLEYMLETEEKVKPSDIYAASHMAHTLHHAALHLYQLGRELWKRGFATPRQLNYARWLVRKTHYLRRYARDVRLLHASLVELSLEASMRRLTFLGTMAIPALLITGFYGMNLEWLPLADNPPLVFTILAAVTATFAYIVTRW